MLALQGKKILLGVSGSIAAYKSPILVRLLIKSGADVKVVVENDTTNLMEVPALYLINEQDQLDYLFQLFEVLS